MKLFFVLSFFSSLIAAELQTDLPRELKTVIASYMADPKDFQSFKAINRFLISNKELAEFRTHPEYSGRLIKAISTESGMPTTVAALLLNNPGSQAWLEQEESLKGPESMVNDIRGWLKSNFVMWRDDLITALENRIPKEIILFVIPREQLDAAKAERSLLAAIEYNEPTIVKALLENGASANAFDANREESALIMAVDNAQPEIVRLLLEYNVDGKEAVKAWKAAQAIANKTTSLFFGYTPEQRQTALELKKTLEEYIRNKRPDLIKQLKSLEREKRFEERQAALGFD